MVRIKKNILVLYYQYLEDCLGNLHDPGLEGEGDAGAARSQLDLHQAPDAIAELDGLVDHVLALKGALGHSEGLRDE